MITSGDFYELEICSYTQLLAGIRKSNNYYYLKILLHNYGSKIRVLLLLIPERTSNRNRGYARDIPLLCIINIDREKASENR